MNSHKCGCLYSGPLVRPDQSGCREASRHQEAGGLEDKVGVPDHAGAGSHVLLMELLQGCDQVPAGLLAADLAVGQIAPHELAEVGFVVVVFQHGVGVVFVVGVGVGVRQIMGELAQGIVL